MITNVIPKCVFVAQPSHDEPVEHPIARRPAVELPAELAEVVLDEAGADIMVDIDEEALGVADGDVDPGQDLPTFSFGMTRGRWRATMDLKLVYDVEGSLMMVELDSILSFTLASRVLDARSSMTIILMYLTSVCLWFFFVGLPSTVSAITRTFVFRWLPQPFLKGFPFSLLGASVVKNPSSSLTISLSVYRYRYPQFMKHRPGSHIVFVAELSLKLRR